MKNTKKLTVNVNIDLYKEINSLSLKLEHKSISETVQYLLEKALYSEYENKTSSVMQQFFREELDKFKEILQDQVTLEAENSLNYINDQIISNLYFMQKCVEATLVGLSWLYDSENLDNSKKFREEALKSVLTDAE